MFRRTVPWLFLLASPLASQQGAPQFQRPVLLLQNAHAEAVQVVAFRPDGQVLASGSADLTIKLWERNSGAMLRTLVGHTQRIRALAFTPDGLRLISSADDHQLIVWDAVTGNPLSSYRSSTAITELGFSPDGMRLAAGGDSTALFDFRADSLIPGPTIGGASAALAWSNDGRWLASAGAGVAIWDASTARLRQRLDLKARCIGFRPDGGLLLAGDEFAVLEPESGKVLERRPAASGERCTLAPGGEWLSGIGADNRIRIWRLAPFDELPPLAGHQGRFGWVFDLAFAPDGHTLASAGEDRSIRLWDPGSGRLVRSLASFADPVESLAFNPGGTLLATGGLGPSGDVQLWELRSGAPGRRIAGRPRPAAAAPASAQEREAAASIEKLSKMISDMGGIATGVSTTWEGGRRPNGALLDRILSGLERSLRPIAFSPDGAALASGSLYRYLDLLDPARGERIRTLTAHLGLVRAVAWAPDGKSFATAGEDRTIKIWDAATYYILKEFPEAHDGEIRNLAFSPDGSLLASSAYDDKTVKLWPAGPGASTGPRVTIRLDGAVFSLGFGRDGHSLVTCGTRVSLWNTSNGKREENTPDIEDRQGSLVACALNPDGTLLALGDNQGRISLVDFRTGQVLHTFVAHNGPVWSLCFAPEGATLVSSSTDSRMAFWEVTTGKLLASAVSLRNGEDWLVAAPDGLFDGTPGGSQLLRWRFSDDLLDTAPAEAFFNEFYHPGLLAELLTGSRPSAPREIGLLDRRPVELAISSVGSAGAGTARDVDLEVHVTQAAPGGRYAEGSGVRDVRLFRNGSLVAVWRGDVLNGRSDVTLRARVPLVAGENRFTGYGFNRDDVRGPIAELALSGSPALSRKGTLYLVAIGINHYANPDFDLTYAVDDARDFLDQMTAQQQALGQYAAIKPIPIFDKDATRANIIAAIGALASIQPEDAVFVFYAGHGTAAGRNFYLIPHDLGYAGQRESIPATAARAMLARSISDRDLEQAFEKIDASHLVLIIDACNSGQVLESEEARRGPMNSRGLAQLAYEKGMFVLTAAQGYQAALEATQLGHGLLTFALMEDGLRSANADYSPRDGRILLREWLDFASLRVPEMQQTLMLEARKVGRSLAFVDGEGRLPKIEDRNIQRPRTYYRREAESIPFVVARRPQ